MKQILTIVSLASVLTFNLSATVVQWFSSPGVTISDNSAAGSTFSSGALGSSEAITDVSVLLNISGGYNGDLYGYLVYTVGGTSVSHLLLDRVGGGSGTSTAAASGFGNGNASADFAALAGNSAILTGDGTGSDIQTTIATAGDYVAAGGSLNSTFGGLTAGGTWTLFLADLGAGDQSTLVSWGLNITVVPEPVTWAMIIFTGGIVTMGIVRHMRRGASGHTAS